MQHDDNIKFLGNSSRVVSERMEAGDIASLNRAMHAFIGRVLKLKDLKKKATKTLGTEIKDLETRVTELHHRITSGMHNVRKKCLVYADLRRFEIYVLDEEGNVIERPRPMTSKERDAFIQAGQGSLFPGDKKTAPPDVPELQPSAEDDNPEDEAKLIAFLENRTVTMADLVAALEALPDLSGGGDDDDVEDEAEKSDKPKKKRGRPKKNSAAETPAPSAPAAEPPPPAEEPAAPSDVVPSGENAWNTPPAEAAPAEEPAAPGPDGAAEGESTNDTEPPPADENASPENASEPFDSYALDEAGEEDAEPGPAPLDEEPEAPAPKVELGPMPEGLANELRNMMIEAFKSDPAGATLESLPRFVARHGEVELPVELDPKLREIAEDLHKAGILRIDDDGAYRHVEIDYEADAAPAIASRRRGNGAAGAARSG